MFGRHLKNQDQTQRGPPGVGFLLTGDGNFNIENKRLCSVGRAEDRGDAVNLHQMQERLNEIWTKLHELQGSIEDLQKDVSETSADVLNLESFVVNGKRLTE